MREPAIIYIPNQVTWQLISTLQLQLQNHASLKKKKTEFSSEQLHHEVVEDILLATIIPIHHQIECLVDVNRVGENGA